MVASTEMVKDTLKGLSGILAMAFSFLPAAVTGFGRSSALFALAAQGFALFPGIVGDYLRVGFYRWTLTECSPNSRISFGTFFAHPEAKIASGVYVGSYCVFGKTAIGARTQIASGVQILSGRHQHARRGDGAICGSDEEAFASVEIGADCWIGAAAIVMADVGEGSTVGAGSVVPRPIPPHSVAVGNPARVVKTTAGDEGTPPENVAHV